MFNKRRANLLKKLNGGHFCSTLKATIFSPKLPILDQKNNFFSFSFEIHLATAEFSIYIKYVFLFKFCIGKLAIQIFQPFFFVVVN